MPKARICFSIVGLVMLGLAEGAEKFFPEGRPEARSIAICSIPIHDSRPVHLQGGSGRSAAPAGSRRKKCLVRDCRFHTRRPYSILEQGVRSRA
jgi:hypothetical protein